MTIRTGRADRLALQLWYDFADQNLQVNFAHERLVVSNGRLYLLPEQALASGRLHLIRYGLLLCEARRGYFKPAQTLALALQANEAQRSINWPADAPAIKQYLAGQDLPLTGPAGWTLVTVDGYPLAWAKQVGNRLKNHYPRGLRR
jgi:NOL1/NOP2/fmu family ribosome biogenesis protein